MNSSPQDLRHSPQAGDRAGRPRPLALVSGLPSDSHTWNLLYLELLIEEAGWDVVNLGNCVRVPLLASEALSLRPDLIALSSVNGHGYQEGVLVAERLRAERELDRTPLVIGGKLGLVGHPDVAAAERLRSAGFDDVYDDEDLHRFNGLLTTLRRAGGEARPGWATAGRCR